MMKKSRKLLMQDGSLQADVSDMAFDCIRQTSSKAPRGKSPEVKASINVLFNFAGRAGSWVTDVRYMRQLFDLISAELDMQEPEAPSLSLVSGCSPWPQPQPLAGSPSPDRQSQLCPPPPLLTAPRAVDLTLTQPFIHSCGSSRAGTRVMNIATCC